MHDELCACALGSPSEEVGGVVFLARVGGGVDLLLYDWAPIANTAVAAARAYSYEPDLLQLATVGAGRELALFHSHPAGSAWPSGGDRAAWLRNLPANLIHGVEGLRLFVGRALEPTPFELVDG